MNISETLVTEFTHEAAATRKLLERVPDSHFGWKPHEKSMSLGQLASHVSDMPSWSVVMITSDEFELDIENYTPYLAGSTAELVERFDKGAAEFLEKLNGLSDYDLMVNWRMTIGGKPVLDLPRLQVIRGMGINHLIHHRGQLTVYLRMHDVPLPAIYGPSADEQV